MTLVQAPMPQEARLRWTREALERLADGPLPRAPVIAAGDVVAAAEGLDIWDSWPLADATGRPIAWRGGELWFALAAPVAADPEQRHFVARIHHFHRRGDTFTHLGPTLPVHCSPGSREWSGSARLAGAMVELYFTAAGVRGEVASTFRQRLFVTRASLSDDDQPFGTWSEPEELVTPGGPYLDADQSIGRIGEIKAFRDPSPWRDGAGQNFLLFTASSAYDQCAHNGMIGLARRDADGRYRAMPPLVDASGTNNELERPHIVEHDGRLYLFWSTQGSVFAPGIAAPTGLYGATARALDGPWELLNGHGLVLANPVSEPFQAFSWWVLPDLSVASFVDYWGLADAKPTRKPDGRAHFGGTFAPFLTLRLDGALASLAE